MEVDGETSSNPEGVEASSNPEDVEANAAEDPGEEEENIAAAGMAKTMAIIGKNAHVLVIPFPAQGHMIPLLDLTHHLATAATTNLTITILVTPKNLPLLSQLLSSHPPIKTLLLPFPSHPSIPSHVENFQDLPPDRLTALIHALGQLYHPLLSWFQSQSSRPPSFILSDMFMGWTQRLASHLGIKRIVFSPSGAMAFSVMCSLWLHLPNPDAPHDQTAVIAFDEIPNCPKYPWWKISPTYRACVGGDPAAEFIRDAFIANVESWGLAWVRAHTERWVQLGIGGALVDVARHV
ncbi:UDP-glucuronosyl/UDP-glucosyltransferase [Corchorus capsularis]|uniref:UDP-glucuronosyl/UDP-glucosyltransferase n=1 Tax=Corchorus capsularis TaxID=210143 RepID=A0A1R3HC91_COCAP|nr:UDP-glucuronosyl/UDP-glucosyltransferase [Corchorus capsularis]